MRWKFGTKVLYPRCRTGTADELHYDPKITPGFGDHRRFVGPERIVFRSANPRLLDTGFTPVQPLRRFGM